MTRRSRVNFNKYEERLNSLNICALIMLDRKEHLKYFQIMKELADLERRGVKAPERVNEKLINISLFIGAITNGFNHRF